MGKGISASTLWQSRPFCVQSGKCLYERHLRQLWQIWGIQTSVFNESPCFWFESTLSSYIAWYPLFVWKILNIQCVIYIVCIVYKFFRSILWQWGSDKNAMSNISCKHCIVYTMYTGHKSFRSIFSVTFGCSSMTVRVWQAWIRVKADPAQHTAVLCTSMYCSIV